MGIDADANAVAYSGPLSPSGARWFPVVTVCIRDGCDGAPVSTLPGRRYVLVPSSFAMPLGGRPDVAGGVLVEFRFMMF